MILKISMAPHAHICSTLWGLLFMNDNMIALIFLLLVSPPLPVLKKDLHFPCFVELSVLFMVKPVWKKISEIRGNMFSEGNGPDALKRFEWNEMNIWHLNCAYSLSHLGSPISSLILTAAQQEMTNASLTTKMLLERFMN